VSVLDDAVLEEALDDAALEELLEEELYRFEECPKVSGAGAGLSESAANRTVSGTLFDESLRVVNVSEPARRDKLSFRDFVVSAKGSLKVSAG
jgi:hypothetical protein